MSGAIRILHLEDDPVDGQLVQDLLKDAGLEAQVRRVDSLAGFEQELAQAELRLILSDFTLPGMNALEALTLARRQRPEVPFIFLSGTLGEELAIHILKEGATDYVLKEHISRLLPAINRALREAEEQARIQQREAELARTSARLDGIISSAMDAIISIDRAQNIVLFNPAAERMFGIKAAEVLGQPLNRFLPARWREMHERHIEQFGRTGVSSRSMGKLGALSGLRANGEEFPIEASISQVELHNERLYTVILRDITARMEAEQLLRANEQRFRMLADNISQLAWMADEKGSIFWYNKRWYDYTGTTLEEMRGWGWQKLQHPDYITRVVEKYRRHLELGEVWEDTFPLRGQDGRYRWFLSRAVPIRDEADRVWRWFGTNTDVTEQRDASEALARARAELQEQADKLERTVAERTAKLRETNAELEAFCYSLSHDMRAPLRAIQNFTQFVLEDCGPELSATGRDYLTKVSTAGRRLDNLIRDVLAFSRLSREEIRLQPISLEKVLNDLLHERPELQAPAAQIQVQLPLPSVLGNEASLNQCLSNLLGNAVKFVAPGVRPQIEVHTEAAAPNLIRLWVQDNGIGIEKEVQEKIFEVFHRGYRGRDYEGTGIGLAIVRRAATRMGGNVGVESIPGQGSRFWLELKAA